MRLYLKLGLIVLVACGSQAALSSGAASETYFALRCLAATTAGDAEAEAKLVGECQRTFLAERECHPTVAVAHGSAN